MTNSLLSDILRERLASKPKKIVIDETTIDQLTGAIMIVEALVEKASTGNLDAIRLIWEKSEFVVADRCGPNRTSPSPAPEDFVDRMVPADYPSEEQFAPAVKPPPEPPPVKKPRKKKNAGDVPSKDPVS